jgi:hypothetical protein
MRKVIPELWPEAKHREYLISHISWHSNSSVLHFDLQQLATFSAENFAKNVDFPLSCRVLNRVRNQVRSYLIYPF